MNISHVSDLGRSFWVYRFTESLSNLGNMAAMIAMTWWVLEKTDSAATLGAVLAPGIAVRVFFTPIMGPFGDRISRKVLIAAGNVICCLSWLLMFLFVFLDQPYSSWQVIGLMCLASFGEAVDNSGASAIVRNIVREEHLAVAIRQTQTLKSITSLVGGAIGGLSVSFLGIAWSLAFNSLSFSIAALSPLFMVIINSNASENGDGMSLKGWYQDLVSGFRFVLGNKVLVKLLALMAIITVSMAPLAMILSVLVKEDRGLPPWFYGVLQSSEAFGGILAVFLLPLLAKKFSQSKVLFMGLALVAVGLVVLPYTPSVALPIFMIFVLGIGIVVSNTTVMTRLHQAVPTEIQSRTFSLIQFSCGVLAPLSLSLSGWVISTIGIEMTLAAIGISVFSFSALLTLSPNVSAFFDSNKKLSLKRT